MWYYTTKGRISQASSLSVLGLLQRSGKKIVNIEARRLLRCRCILGRRAWLHVWLLKELAAADPFSHPLHKGIFFALCLEHFNTPYIEI